MNNLGWMLKATGGDLVECLTVLRTALQMQRELIGIEHPDTLTSMNKLALILQDQGNASEAAELCSEALVARRAVLGNRHQGTLLSMCSLGSLYLEIGHVMPALALFKEAVDGAHETLGDEHPYTRSFTQHLAMAVRAAERAQAEGRAAARSATATSLGSPNRVPEQRRSGNFSLAVSVE